MSAPAKPTTTEPAAASPAPAAAAGGGGKLMLAVIVLCSANVGATGFVLARVLKQPAHAEARAESPKKRTAVAEKKDGGDEGGGADGGKTESAKGEGGSDDDAAPAEGDKAAAKKPGPCVPLEPFLVNLNEPGSGRYLKAAVEVEVTDGASAEEMNTQKRSIRDDLLRYLSSLSVADTLGESGKDKIKLAMAGRIGKQIGGAERVHKLFFTEFMVQ